MLYQLSYSIGALAGVEPATGEYKFAALPLSYRAVFGNCLTSIHKTPVMLVSARLTTGTAVIIQSCYFSINNQQPNSVYRAYPYANFVWLTFYAQHLFQCVDDFHQVRLRIHYFFNGLVGCWCFVDDVFVLPAFHACRCQ